MVFKISHAPNVAVTQKSGRIYVPIRFVAEAFNCTVTYDSKTRMVIITTAGNKPVVNGAFTNWDKNFKDFDTVKEAIECVVQQKMG